MIKVLLTHNPSKHTCYTEMVAVPPDGVSFFWKDYQRSVGVQNSAIRTVIMLLLRMARLPNIRILRAGSYDNIQVIHSCQNLLLSRIPWVVDIEHGCPFVGIHFDRLQNLITCKVIKMIISHQSCKAIIAWTHTAANGFIKSLNPKSAIIDKIKIISPAISANRDIEKKKGSGRCRLLFVASPPEWNFILKGGREVIEACRILRSKGKDVHLTMVGPAPEEIVSECRMQGEITFAGIVGREELARFYREADIYVMPSFSDTFGMVFLEAMSFSLPIVALNRPYTKEIVKNGEVGLLVDLSANSIHWSDSDGRLTMNSDAFIRHIVHSSTDMGVVDGLVEKIGCLVDDPRLRRRLGENGYEEVVRGRFSVTRRNMALRQIYLEAAGANVHEEVW